MNLSDFLTFVFTVMVLIILYFKKKWEKKMREQHPEQQSEQEKALSEFLRSLEGDMEEMKEQEKEPVIVREVKRAPPPPPQEVEKEYELQHATRRTVSDSFKFESDLETYRQKSVVEDHYLQPKIKEELFESLGDNVVSSELTQEVDAYEIAKVDERSRLSNKLHQLASMRDLVIFHEVMGKPKSMRQEPPFHTL